MKKKFYIKDFIQTTEMDQSIYYMGYTTAGSWTEQKSLARAFDTEQEAFLKLEELKKNEGLSEYELITIYY